jgi:nucleoside-diphosphate-sugar epimerase
MLRRAVYTIGDGNQLFQFLHPQDLIDAYMLAMRKEKTGIYNVGAKHFGTLREALENVISYAGSKSKVISLPTRFSIGCLRLYCF